MKKTVINSILFAITVISNYFVCYNREILLIKYAKPNQTTEFARYNRVFVITVIVITEFDCICKHIKTSKNKFNNPAFLGSLHKILIVLSRYTKYLF